MRLRITVELAGILCKSTKPPNSFFFSSSKVYEVTALQKGI